MKDIQDYIENKERVLWEDNEQLSNAKEDYLKFQTNRKDSGFDWRADIGIRILQDDLEKGVYGNRTSRRDFINFTDKNLRYKASELQAADVELGIHSHDGQISRGVELLEAETTYIFDYLNVLRLSHQITIDSYFQGLGVSFTGWDSLAHAGENWMTGLPVVDSVDPRKIYVNPGVTRADYSDVRQIFHYDEYGRQELINMYPESEQDILEAETLADTTFGIIHLVKYNYYKPYIIKQRRVIDNLDEKVSDWMEADYQDYLEEQSAVVDIDLLIAEIEPQIDKEFTNPEELSKAIVEYYAEPTEENKINVLDLVCQENIETAIMPEKVVSTNSRDVEYRYWFEVVFLQQTTTLIQEPRLKRISGYSFFPGLRDPNFSYPFSLAFKSAPLLEAHSLLYSLQLFYAIRYNKPQLVLIPGAIKNKTEFLKHRHKPNFVVNEVAGWREKGGYPANQKPFYYVYPEDMGATAELLEQKIERWIDLSLRTPKAVQGESEFAGESGKSIVAKQYSAKQGDKSDLYKLGELFKGIFYNLAVLISVHKDGYRHKTMFLNDQDEKDMVWVNVGDENELADVTDDIYVEVQLSDNVDLFEAHRKEDAMRLFEKGLITWMDTLKMWNPDNVDKLIKNKREENEDLMLMQELDKHPELKEQVIQTLTQMPEEEDVEQSPPGTQ